MINTKLDTKFGSFLADTKQKIFDLGKELECLSKENSYLEQQVSNIFQSNNDLQVQIKNFEDQLQRFKSIHTMHLKEHQVLTDKVSRAKFDYENLSQALQKQTDLIRNEANSINEKERMLRINRQTREEMFQTDMQSLDFRLLELNKEMQLKQDMNNGLRSELNNSRNIEESIISSIKAEMISLNSLTSKSFYKKNK